MKRTDAILGYEVDVRLKEALYRTYRLLLLGLRRDILDEVFAEDREHFFGHDRDDDNDQKWYRDTERRMFEMDDRINEPPENESRDVRQETRDEHNHRRDKQRPLLFLG